MPRRNQTPKHQPFLDRNPCRTKRRFSDQNSANDAIEVQELTTPGIELTAYKCERCGGWHLTRRTPEA